MINSTFTNNSAKKFGGAIAINHYGVGINSSHNLSFFKNHALEEGGAIYICSGSFSNSSNFEFNGNSALYGGAIYANSKLNNLTGFIFTNNKA
jgi:predicted outer membrane repeat protein